MKFLSVIPLMVFSFFMVMGVNTVHALESVEEMVDTDYAGFNEYYTSLKDDAAKDFFVDSIIAELANCTDGVRCSKYAKILAYIGHQSEDSTKISNAIIDMISRDEAADISSTQLMDKIVAVQWLGLLQDEVAESFLKKLSTPKETLVYFKAWNKDARDAIDWGTLEFDIIGDLLGQAFIGLALRQNDDHNAYLNEFMIDCLKSDSITGKIDISMRRGLQGLEPAKLYEGLLNAEVVRRAIAQKGYDAFVSGFFDDPYLVEYVELNFEVDDEVRAGIKK